MVLLVRRETRQALAPGELIRKRWVMTFIISTWSTGSGGAERARRRCCFSEGPEVTAQNIPWGETVHHVRLVFSKKRNRDSILRLRRIGLRSWSWRMSVWSIIHRLLALPAPRQDLAVPLPSKACFTLGATSSPPRKSTLPTKRIFVSHKYC